jgi:hypothetical protein
MAKKCGEKRCDVRISMSMLQKNLICYRNYTIYGRKNINAINMHNFCSGLSENSEKIYLFFSYLRCQKRPCIFSSLLVPNLALLSAITVQHKTDDME